MQPTQGKPVQNARMFEDSLYRGVATGGGPVPPDDFNKMFPALNPFAKCAEPYISQVRELGRKGGLMDALDPRVTVTNPLAANDTKTPHPTHPGRGVPIRA
jgi:hypothetical protein